MRPIDLIIIYLVVGAPFAVRGIARGAQEVEFPSHKVALRSYLVSLKEGLFWPWSLVQCFSTRLKQRKSISATNGHTQISWSSVEHSLNQCLAALNDLAAIERDAAFGRSTFIEMMHRDTRDVLEKYAGLTWALVLSSDNDNPAPLELELARLSGLEGDELLIAGLCIHRRYHSRLKLHQQSSRTQLLGILDTWLDDYEISERECTRSFPIARIEVLANLCLRIGELARTFGNPDIQLLVYERLNKRIAELPVNERELKDGPALNGV